MTFVLGAVAIVLEIRNEKRPAIVQCLSNVFRAVYCEVTVYYVAWSSI